MQWQPQVVFGKQPQFCWFSARRWLRAFCSLCRDKLKQPVLATEQLETNRDQTDSRLWNPQSARGSVSNAGADGQSDAGLERNVQTVPGLKVNLDGKLLEMLRDVRHLQRAPHDVSLLVRKCKDSLRAAVRCVQTARLWNCEKGLASFFLSCFFVAERQDRNLEVGGISVKNSRKWFPIKTTDFLFCTGYVIAI